MPVVAPTTRTSARESQSAAAPTTTECVGMGVIDDVVDDDKVVVEVVGVPDDVVVVGVPDDVVEEVGVVEVVGVVDVTVEPGSKVTRYWVPAQ